MITSIFVILAVLIVLAVLFAKGVLPRAAFFIVASVIVVIGAVVLIKVSQIKTMIATPYAMPPDTVSTARAAQSDWQPELSSVGTLNAVQGVMVSAQLDGNVAKIAFEAGAKVKAGDLLLQQDVAAETAQLRAAEAAADLAKVNLRRSRELLSSHTIAQSQFDTDNAAYAQALAQADNIRAVIAKKTIRAPFSGRLGVRLVNLGQTLKAGDAIVSLQSLDPIYADFYLPQQDLARVAKGQEVRLDGDGVPGGTAAGKVTAINPDVDSQTRNVRVEATVENPSEQMRPGMFVHVRLLLPDKQRVLAIPATAVLYAPYGNSVFVVSEGKDPMSGKPAKVIHQQFVRLGETRGDFVAVTEGLSPGDEVVSAGVFKLRSGEAVVIDNSKAPPAQLAPHPQNS
ncbi:MAG TPA: efflux RND transporter periplasmic adaptor subunit [Opitutaceae bacterium]|nr:efflux RND transporter periplasmic adaptor subunit [Opitutaceae bacterium]